MVFILFDIAERKAAYILCTLFRDGGHIAAAVFWDATNAYVGDTPLVLRKKDFETGTDRNHKYMNYYVGRIVVTIYVGVDERGEVDLWVKEVIKKPEQE